MPGGIDFIDKDEDVGEITIYGIIQDRDFYQDGSIITPKFMKDELDKFKNKKRINVFFNSGGGGIFAGNTIYSNLVRHKAETWGYVDGVAASIASLVLQGCQNRVVTENSLIMIHDPIVGMMGYIDAKGCRKLADELDKCKDVIVPAYINRSHMKEEEIRAMMEAETWMTGEEAVEFGFADTLEKGKDFQNCIKDGELFINGQMIDPSIYKAFPKSSISTYSDFNPQNPYPNEHAARVREPGDFKPDSFRRKNISSGIDIIIGKLKSGGDSMETQAYRFDAKKYTAEQAKKWLKDHKIKYISFEPASKGKEDLASFPNLNLRRNILNNLKLTF
jgi:ATP-dependent Clp protease protease subunit